MVEIIMAAVIAFSVGVVVGRLVRAPIGRWALLVAVIAAVSGGAYVYGMMGALKVSQAAPWIKLFPKLW